MGDTTRLFVTTRQGLVKIMGVPNGNNMGTFLDMTSIVDDDHRLELLCRATVDLA